MTFIAVCVWYLLKEPELPWWVWVAIFGDLLLYVPKALDFWTRVFS